MVREVIGYEIITYDGRWSNKIYNWGYLNNFPVLCSKVIHAVSEI